jgi:hypothetical protein
MRISFQPRYARRTLLVALAVLLLSPILGSILVDRCPLSARDREASDTITRWHAHATAPDILILGSSRTGHSIDTFATTSLLREAVGDGNAHIFNAALPAGDPIMLKFLAERLLDHGPAPRIVMLEVNVDTSARRNVFFDSAITQLFTARDIVEHFDDILHASRKTWSRLLSSRLIPFYRHRGQLRAWIAQSCGSFFGVRNPAPPVEFEGISWAIRVQEDIAGEIQAGRRARNLRRLGDQLTGYEISGKTPAALERVVALCRERGASVILFEPPLQSVHRALYTPAVLERFTTFTDRLVAMDHCRLVDLSARLPDTMFADTNHVDFTGRDATSRIVAQEVLAPAWREMKQE